MEVKVKPEEKLEAKQEVKEQLPPGIFATKVTLGFIRNIYTNLGNMESYERSNNYAKKWETLETLEKIKTHVNDIEALYKGRLIHGK